MTTTITTLLERWASDDYQPKITLAWEVLPALDGTLHAVEVDPDAYTEFAFKHPEFAVSLCGKTLVVKDAVVLDSGTCPVCQEISKERQAEFDAEQEAKA